MTAANKSVNVLMIGLGKLGMPLCRRMAAQGHKVSVFSTGGYAKAVTRAAAVSHGAQPVDSIRTWLESHKSVSELYLVTCVPTSAEVSGVADLVINDASMLEATPEDSNRPALHWVDCSSGFPPLTRSIAQRLTDASELDASQRRRTVFTDCAVSGGPHGANAGVLTSMVGTQEPEVVADENSGVRSLINCWSGAPGGNIFNLGPVGSGHAVKSINNALLAANLLLGSEAMVTLAKAGVDIEAALGAIGTSSGRTFVLQGRFPKNILTRKFDYGFDMSGLRKDVANALALMKSEEVHNPMSALAMELVNECHDRLGPLADHTEVVKMVEDKSNASGCVRSNPQ